MTHKAVIAAAAVFAAGLGAYCYFERPKEIVGLALVVDGDTLTIRGQNIRLAGIDAPEKHQPCIDGTPCGMMATAHLIKMIGGHHVMCLPEGTDKYHRVLATCYVTEGRDIQINRAMVLNGFAIDYTHFSNGVYAAEQQEAQDNKRGLWARGGFEEPWHYRQGHKFPTAKGDKYARPYESR